MQKTIEKSIFEIEKLKDYFSEKKESKSNDKSALDLGCGIPTYLFNLEIVFGFNKLIGIEKLTERESIERGVKYQRAYNYRGLESFLACYKQHLNILTNDRIITSISHNRRIRNYEKHFSFEHLSIEELNFDRIPEMDIILAINSLDFISKESAKDVIKKMCEKIKVGGLIIIELKHEENNKIMISKNVEKIGHNQYINLNTNEKIYLYDTKELLEIEKLIQSYGFTELIESQLYRNPSSETIKSALLTMMKK